MLIVYCLQSGILGKPEGGWWWGRPAYIERERGAWTYERGLSPVKGGQITVVMWRLPGEHIEMDKTVSLTILAIHICNDINLEDLSPMSLLWGMVEQGKCA